MNIKKLSSSTARALNTLVRTQKVSRLADGSLKSFRRYAFSPEIPALISREHLEESPAVSKWFHQDATSNAKLNLNTKYLEKYGSVVVPLEITAISLSSETFTKIEGPLADFLSFIESQQHASTSNALSTESRAVQIYLAQCSISSLPPELAADLPIPSFVTHAGRGDIYDSSIWLGLAPTYTTLHKDPNPNLLVQLAGRKIVRIFEPHIGKELFVEAQRRIGMQGSASFRGEEMMYGEEKRVLEELVWGDQRNGGEGFTGKVEVTAYEAALTGGDAVFIPKGWWHSVKGVGKGIVGSANWWFR